MTQDRWNSFSKSQHLLMIGSEIMRAKTWQAENQKLFQESLERGINLIDNCFSDPKWREDFYALLFLRDRLGEFYLNSNTGNIETLYHSL